VATPWSIEFTRLAREQLDALRDSILVRVSRALLRLADNPFASGMKRLRAPEELYRIRVGDFRVIFTVDRQERVLTVTRVRHRKDVYRGL
jgi:mRNA interferase RelE/StbE